MFQRMRMAQFTVVALVAACLGSCASVDVVEFREGKHENGVRFYRPALHFLITKAVKDGSQQFLVEPMWLPDYDSEYFICWDAGWFGSVKPSFTLADGWNLVGMETEVNSGGGAVAEAFSGIASAAIEKFLTDGGPESVVKQGLYKVAPKYDNNGHFSQLEFELVLTLESLDFAGT